MMYLSETGICKFKKIIKTNCRISEQRYRPFVHPKLLADHPLLINLSEEVVAIGAESLHFGTLISAMIPKQALHETCLAFVKNQKVNLLEALDSAQDAVKEESKSAVGDKHETSRSMLQLEVEQLSTQLDKVEAQDKILRTIYPEKKMSTAQTGSAVITSNGNYYIAIGLGMKEVNQEKWFFINISSPVGLALKDKKAGDKISFNGQEITIKEIY